MVEEITTKVLNESDIKILNHSAIYNDIPEQNPDGTLTGISKRYFMLKISFPKIEDKVYHLKIEEPVTDLKVKQAIKTAYEEVVLRVQDKVAGLVTLQDVVQKVISEGVDIDA